MRQVVERRLHELELEQSSKGLAAWSDWIAKHPNLLEPPVKDFIKPFPGHIPMIPSAKLAITEVYHDVWCEAVLNRPLRKDQISQATTTLASQTSTLSAMEKLAFL